MLTKKSAILSAALLALGGGLSAPLGAQGDPFGNGTAGVGLLLRKLDGEKRVLLIGAHPDDEDTSLLSALSRGMGVETAYLSLTRGEGGQNLLGNELDEGLGLLRTGELMAARSLDGGSQYFTRAFDFGFSKTAEETLRQWPRDSLLADVTWVIRTFRPQVVVSVFSGTPRDGHGQHQVSGILAQAAFAAAGDPSAFPEQLQEGAGLWTPAKLYRRTRFGPDDMTTEVETGRFDPLLGMSHYQLAMESRSQHRSQDMGMPRPLGPRTSSLSLVESLVGGANGGNDTFFAGVDTALLGLARKLEDGVRQEVEPRLRTYGRAIASAREGLDALAPWAVTAHLEEALVALRGVRWELGTGAGSELGWVVERRIPLLEEAVVRSRGIIVDVRVEDDLLVPGEEVGAVVEVWNGGPEDISDVGAAMEIPSEWVARLEEGEEGVMIPSQGIARWRFLLRIPENAALSRPYFLEGPRDGDLYRWPPDPRLRGLPGAPPSVYARVHLAGEGAIPLSVRRTAGFKGVDKATGEFVEPLLVVPALSVSLNPTGTVWPIGQSGSRGVTVRVRNEGEAGASGVVEVDLPDGWRAEPEEYSLELEEPGAEGAFSFQVFPPANLIPGEYRMTARVRSSDGATYREGFTLVDYPHVARSALFSPASTRISVVPVAVEPGIRVGYVMGSGDLGAEALEQMGVAVRMLGPDAVRAGDYQDLDVVVLGIRAYETRPDLAAANEKLLDFARAGGTVIVQYNKYEYPQGGFAPYPVSISRPHDRVSDETVPVRILEPDHPVFNEPNRITDADFQGWAQERGLYFLGEWDERYVPMLEMSDPGEAPKRGGLLVAPLGKGLYVYTGLAFFRQFPDGVPGAFRLFANLVSLKGQSTGGE
jgi:LmbE family N-acetylglucosaminyl deacetylase